MPKTIEERVALLEHRLGIQYPKPPAQPPAQPASSGKKEGK